MYWKHIVFLPLLRMNIEIDKFDEKLFLALNGNYHSWLDYFMVFASNLFSFVPVFLITIFIAIKYFRMNDDGYHPYLNVLLLIMVLFLQFVVSHYFLNDFFKKIIHLDRPCENPEISPFVRLVGRDCHAGVYSLFSYKTCLIFSLCSFLFFTIKEGYNKFKVTLLIWAFFVAYSRVYVGDHYPINIFLSGLIGILQGFIVNRIYFYIKYRLLVI